MICGHVSEMLAAYINGTLAPAEARSVRDHLSACRVCQQELLEWEQLKTAILTMTDTAPLHVPGEVWAAINQGSSDHVRCDAPFSLLWQLLRGQIPLVQRAIWLTSALTIAVGCLVALTMTSPTGPGMIIAFVMPFVTAMGIAFLYGPENDPALEIALATPTSPWRVLLARLTLVYGYDLVLALTATLALAVVKDAQSIWVLILLWIGPMLFLSALTLVLSLILGTATAIVIATVLWGTRLVAMSYSGLVSSESTILIEAFWSANGILLPLALLLFAFALFYAPQHERFV